MQSRSQVRVPAVSPSATVVGAEPAQDVDGSLEKAPVAQVLATLGVKPDQGLSAAEAAKRLAQYGPNAIVEKERSLLPRSSATSRARSR